MISKDKNIDIERYSDSVYDAFNGFLMHTDLHLLFDANHLRIEPTSESVAEVEVDEINTKILWFYNSHKNYSS